RDLLTSHAFGINTLRASTTTYFPYTTLFRSSCFASNLKNVAITANALAAPTLTSPANGASGISTGTSFSWTAVSGATSYRIMVAISRGEVRTQVTSGTCSTCIINDTPSGTTY